MAGEQKHFNMTGSELLWIGVLVLLVALTRVYYGAGRGIMVVWKGDLSFQDTLVDVDKMLRLSKEELMDEHRSVLYQLEAMEILDPADIELQNIREKKWRGRTRPKPSSVLPEAKQETSSTRTDANQGNAPATTGSKKDDPFAEGEAGPTTPLVH